jgi:RNA polymerase subunit RPABC4/transcription elongation factor Spt4
MGMFDSVVAECPNCKEILEFQTKAGSCLLNEIPLDKVPLNIAYAVHGDTETCPSCNQEYVLTMDERPPSTVKMSLKKK